MVKNLGISLVVFAMLVGMCSGTATAGPRCHGGRSGGLFSRLFHRGGGCNKEQSQAAGSCSSCGNSTQYAPVPTGMVPQGAVRYTSVSNGQPVTGCATCPTAMPAFGK